MKSKSLKWSINLRVVSSRYGIFRPAPWPNGKLLLLWSVRPWHGTWYPPTIYRRQASIGPGSLQFYIEHDPNYHYFNFTPEDHQRLRPTALFDLVINNADRKGSHVLVGNDQHIRLIDHGVAFHVEDKLRTVIWDFAGEEIPGNLQEDLLTFLDKLQPEDPVYKQLLDSLRQSEIRAMARRVENILDSGQFPYPPEDRRVYPWPPV
jgi:uncharacterized repeat protein (TIGR03843 family)